MPEDEPWRRLLHEAITALALPPDEQARVNVPRCVACELLNDFDHARTVTLSNASDLTGERRGLLDQIDAAIRQMEQPDLECFDSEVVRRPAWQRLRELAVELLRAFGWERVTLEPYVEIRPGVWQRPATDAGPSSGPDQSNN